VEAREGGRKNIKSPSNSRSLNETIYNCEKIFTNYKEKQRNIEYYKELQ